MIKKLIIFLIIIIIAAAVTLKIKTIDKPLLLVGFTNQWGGFKVEDLEMLYEILNEKYTVITSNIAEDIIIDGVFNNKSIQNKKALKIFYTYEAVEPRIDGYDLSIGYDYIDQPNYIRIPYNYIIKDSNAKNINTNFSRETCNPNKKYFACFLNSNSRINSYINGNKYDGVILRDRMFHQLSLYKRVESGGKHLNNIGGKPIKKEQTAEWLSQCKFIIAYENQSYPGYITEKVYQAYFAGSVPIYYSDKKAVKDINKKAVIFTPDFTSEEAVVEYIKKIDNDDKLYCDIWNEKLVNDPDKNYEVIKEQLRKKLEPILDEYFNRHP